MAFFFTFLFLFALHLYSSETALIAANGKSLMPIVIGEKSSAGIYAIATNLAFYLSKISDARFNIETGKTEGIKIGIPSDFPEITNSFKFKGGVFGREDYILRSTKKSLFIVGATELGTRHAAWDLLYLLGYRQFFPGNNWEIIPSLKKIEINVDKQEEPHFHARRIWYNWGLWGYNNEPYKLWCERNRHSQGFQLNSGHAYEHIISVNKAEFDSHPEYLALINGTRYKGGDAKFCISNPELRKLVVNYAIDYFKKNPSADSISMEPSDGGNWCTCENCTKMGSPSDRALTLANEVAEAINKLGIGDKYVGMYAYNQHCPPPTIKVHPRVIISVTTAFITGGYTLDEIINGWSSQGATLGIYDYYSVIDWDWNLPGRAKAAYPVNVANSIVNFYRKGARFYDCESGDAWGPYGLGYYIAARTMWNTGEAARVNEIFDDFLNKAFGPAAEPMRGFYTLINFDSSKRSASDMVGRMYRYLAEAKKIATNNKQIVQRINDLILYTRYVEMYNNYANLTGDSVSKARDELVSFVYRIRKTMMVHAYGFWARTVGQGAAHQNDHPLKDEMQFTEAEINAILEKGISANQPSEMGFTSVTFSNDLVPADPLELPDVPTGVFPNVPQDTQTYYIWVPKAPANIQIKVTVQKVWNLRPHHIRLFSPLEVTLKPVVDYTGVKPDGTTYDVNLPTPYDGLHKIEIVDGGDYTRIVWPEKMKVTLPSGIDTPGVFNHFRGGWTLYFYVPKDTKVIGGWAARIANWAPRISGVLKDPDGNTVMDFSQREDGWFTAPVKEGQDGKLWKFENSQGVRQLMTVPPFLARNNHELLLPKEVVEKDSKK